MKWSRLFAARRKYTLIITVIIVTSHPIFDFTCIIFTYIVNSLDKTEPSGSQENKTWFLQICQGYKMLKFLVIIEFTYFEAIAYWAMYNKKILQLDRSTHLHPYDSDHLNNYLCDNGQIPILLGPFFHKRQIKLKI